MGALLEVKDLVKKYKAIVAVNGASFSVEKGVCFGLLGPNGAGKTTFFNCLTGIYAPTKGEMLVRPSDLKTRRLNGLKPNYVTAAGLARTFQNIRLFQNMTVLENVMIGRHCRTSAGIVGAIAKNRSTRKEENKIVEDSYAVLEKIGLAKFVNEFAKNLPYGAQRRLEIARAMATDPFMLLLDEPAAGMNPQETHELDELIIRIRDNEGISILLIEHDMKLVMSLSDRIFVMDYGKKIAQGTPEIIRQNPAVIKAYLGEEIDA